MNVVIGASGQTFDGWVSTDVECLDLTSPQAWERMFKVNSIDRLLIEHVLEHLSEEECRAGLAECHRYLKPGGLLRIAVPDGYRRDEEYVAAVSPPIYGHQILFTVDTLSALLESFGFSVTPLEYFDAQGEFHACPWDVVDGYVSRSSRFDRREEFRYKDVFYTSLIVDARKT